MPLKFSFRRRQVKRPPTPDAEHLKSELNEAVERLLSFSSVLRKELEVSSSEENIRNPQREE